MTTLDQILKITREELASERLILAVHDKIGAVMETYKGKVVTRRALEKIRVALADIFPAECVQWVDGPVSVSIAVWGKGTPWLTHDVRHTWDLGYSDAPLSRGGSESGRYLKVSYGGRAAFEEQSPSTGRGCRERNASREKLLADPAAQKKLADAIDAKIKADAALKALLEFDETGPYQADRYDFERLAKLD